MSLRQEDRIERSSAVRRFLHQLTAFPSMFDRDSAAAVTQVTLNESAQLIDLLLQHSMILPHGSRSEQELFTVGRSARTQIAQTPHDPELINEARNRHAQYFLLRSEGRNCCNTYSAQHARFEQVNIGAALEHVTTVIAQLPCKSSTLPVEGLTPRERQVARLVSAGMTNRQIGHDLGIATWTVVNHIRAIMRKTGCLSRVEIARWMP